jgi:hypothetical protein
MLLPPKPGFPPKVADYELIDVDGEFDADVAECVGAMPGVDNAAVPMRPTARTATRHSLPVGYLSPLGVRGAPGPPPAFAVRWPGRS